MKDARAPSTLNSSHQVIKMNVCADCREVFKFKRVYLLAFKRIKTESQIHHVIRSPKLLIPIPPYPPYARGAHGRTHLATNVNC